MVIDCNMKGLKEKKTLKEKIEVAIKEAGHTPFVCIMSDCLERQYYSVKSTHCADQLPYVYRTTHRINVIDLCHKKIEEYYK